MKIFKTFILVLPVMVLLSSCALSNQKSISGNGSEKVSPDETILPMEVRTTIKTTPVVTKSPSTVQKPNKQTATDEQLDQEAAAISKKLQSIEQESTKVENSMSDTPIDVNE